MLPVSVVYNCTEKKTGMKCAVKVMDLEELSDDEFAKIALESTICDVSLSCSACNSRSPWFALFLASFSCPPYVGVVERNNPNLFYDLA